MNPPPWLGRSVRWGGRCGGVEDEEEEEDEEEADGGMERAVGARGIGTANACRDDCDDEGPKGWREEEEEDELSEEERADGVAEPRPERAAQGVAEE